MQISLKTITRQTKNDNLFFLTQCSARVSPILRRLVHWLPQIAFQLTVQMDWNLRPEIKRRKQVILFTHINPQQSPKLKTYQSHLPNLETAPESIATKRSHLILRFIHQGSYKFKEMTFKDS